MLRDYSESNWLMVFSSVLLRLVSLLMSAKTSHKAKRCYRTGPVFWWYSALPSALYMLWTMV